MKFTITILAFNALILLGINGCHREMDHVVPKNTFLYQNLKDWTEQAFDWNESKKGARGAYDFGTIPILKEKYIPKEELSLALKTYREKVLHSAMVNPDNWLNNDSRKNPNVTEDEYFAHKINLNPDHEIVVMGDFHGSLHSLLRNLWRLHQMGYLANDFSLLRPHTSFIFTGDFIDRGRYGAEILYTLLRLKLANWERVHLIRGNHEEKNTAKQYGFEKEIAIKYDDDEFFKDIIDSFRFLPVVLLVQLEKNGIVNNIHFSHGGYGLDTTKNIYSHQPSFLLEAAAGIQFEKIPQKKHLGYQWSDFQQNWESAPSARGFDIESGVFTSGLNDLNDYLAHNNIKAIFRGHQDREFGVKLLFKEADVLGIDNAKNKTSLYKNGPYHWNDVVLDKSLVDSAKTSGLPLTLFAPVFTFTTASEGQAIPFDAFAIILCKEKWEDFRMLIHEISLPRSRPDLSYVNISPKIEPMDDEIHVEFKDHGPGRLSF